jgi:CSLREA domain-containing protein
MTPGRRLSNVGLTAIFALTALAFTATASAAVFQVTNTNDPGSGKCEPGNCSLRDAIEAANAGSGSDTVLVPAGVYTLGAGGVLGIVNGMHIIGTAGATQTEIDAHNASGVMKINGAAGSVSLTGLTLTRGQSASGSAIETAGEALILAEDVFTSNTSGGAGSKGEGAVVAEGLNVKALTVTDSSFTNDTAGGDGNINPQSGQGVGGAITFRASGALTVTDSTFIANSAGGNGGAGGSSAQGSGGAIFATGNDTIAIAGSTFTANTAGGNGGEGTSSAQGDGGAFAASGTDTITVTGSTFTGNRAGGNGGIGTSSAQGAGGAIETFGDDTVSVTGSSFVANKTGGNGGAGVATASGSGGALSFYGNGTGDTFTITASTFTANQAGGASGSGSNGGEGAGGAIEAFSKGALALTNDTVEGNSVGGPLGAALGGGAAGGGLATGLATTLLNDTIDGNQVIGSGGSGGNIQANFSSVALENTIVAAGGAAHGPNCAGTTFTSQGHNLEDTTPSQCGLSAAMGDLIGADPLLGALQSNGGPTQTQALLAGSPAIDAGTDSGCPATDERGVARPQGSACDIGAYEVAPPTVSTGSVTALSTSGATLSGTVTPNSADASVYFQIGTSTAYGLQTSVQHVGGVTPSGVSASIGGLSPNTTYHYRLVASSTDGTSIGADQTFTTPSAPGGPIGSTAASIHKAVISALKETRSVFAVAASSTPRTGHTAATHHHPGKAKRHHRGTVFSFRLDQPAAVKIAIQRVTSGRRVGHSCRQASHKLRHKRRCTRTVTIATLTRSGHVGSNKVAFSGRIGRKALKPGRYRAVFSATNAAGKSAPQRLTFTIVKR